MKENRTGRNSIVRTFLDIRVRQNFLRRRSISSITILLKRTRLKIKDLAETRKAGKCVADLQRSQMTVISLGNFNLQKNGVI